MASPLPVTIVCATYNRPALLDVELGSIRVAASKVPNPVRIIVVDDCSRSMGAHAVAKKWEADYIRLPENRGVAGALYEGFQRVASPLYALWGDDDYFLPNWFTLHLRKIAEGCDVVAGSYWRTDANLNRKKRAVILPVATLDDLKRGHVTVNDGALVRRDALGDIQFRPERERAMMMTFWLAMASKGVKFGVVQEATWLYRRHATNLSNSRSKHDNDLRAEALAAYR